MDVDKEFLKLLGKRIDELRKERKLSFQEMANLCDMEKANLVKLTSRGKNVTINTLHTISRGLNISLKELFDFNYPNE